MEQGTYGMDDSKYGIKRLLTKRTLCRDLRQNDA